MNSLKGIAAAPGVAMGKALVFNIEDIAVPRYTVADDKIPAEVLRLEEALTQTRHQILRIQKKLADELGQEHAEIFDAHLLVLEDQSLHDEIVHGLKTQKLNVEHVFNEVVRKHLKAFSRTEDEYL